jgi:hypothetical protein
MTRELEIEAEELIALTAESLTVRTTRGSLETISRSDCLGFLNLAAMSQPRATSVYAPLGVLVLTDGQRLPGSPMVGPGDTEGALQWRHRLLSRVQVPLDMIAWAGFRTTVPPPQGGEADAVFLTNGDRVEGFITEVDDPLLIEQDGGRTRIELDRIESIRLVAPPAKPLQGATRVWFDDGSVIDVLSLTLHDDGMFHFLPRLTESAEGDIAMQPTRVLAVLFDIDAVAPLASCPVMDVEGPVTRYLVPEPEVSEAELALGLRDVTLRGPLVVRYALPAGASRFIGEAELAGDADEWSDCELVISTGDREVRRERLSRDRPRIRFDISIEGGELALEVTEGANGPIGDHIVIRSGMIVLDE